VFVSRGGVYAEGADTQTPYLRQFLGFIGLEPEFVFAEGLPFGEESRQESLAAARERVASLATVGLAA
jgi:FMN-dependent NADH-azoreductase